MARCKVLPKSQLPTHIAEQMDALNLGTRGCMQDELQRSPHNKLVYYIVEKKKVLAWSIRCNRRAYGFFTDFEYRHLGYATRLIKYMHDKIREKLPVHLYSWNLTSPERYKKLIKHVVDVEHNM